MSKPRMTRQTVSILGELMVNPEEERYGLEILRNAGLKSGTAYPALARLEEHELVSSRWEDEDPAVVGRPRRRLYRLTPEGVRVARAELRESESAAKQMFRPGAQPA
jgi:DNA-binding PadR family transcriptional regulator